MQQLYNVILYLALGCSCKTSATQVFQSSYSSPKDLKLHWRQNGVGEIVEKHEVAGDAVLLMHPLSGYVQLLRIPNPLFWVQLFNSMFWVPNWSFSGLNHSSFSGLNAGCFHPLACFGQIFSWCRVLATIKSASTFGFWFVLTLPKKQRSSWLSEGMRQLNLQKGTKKGTLDSVTESAASNQSTQDPNTSRSSWLHLYESSQDPGTLSSMEQNEPRGPEVFGLFFRSHADMKITPLTQWKEITPHHTRQARPTGDFVPWPPRPHRVAERSLISLTSVSSLSQTSVRLGPSGTPSLNPCKPIQKHANQDWASWVRL